MLDSLVALALSAVLFGQEPRPFPAFQTIVAAGADGVRVFDQNFAPVDVTFDVTEARDVTIGTDGMLWVSDVDTVKKFDANGTLLDTLASPSMGSSFRGIGQFPFGQIGVCDEANDQIVIFELESGSSGALALPNVDGPTDLAFTSNGTFYVVAAGSDEIVELDLAGREVQSESLSDPSCVEITCNGIVLVSRPTDGLLTRLDGATFDVLDEIAVASASGIALAPRGEVLISDPTNEKIHRLDLASGDLSVKGFIDLSGFAEVSGMTVAPQRFAVKGKARTLLEGQITQQKVEGIWSVRAFAGQSSLELAYGADGPAATYFRCPTGIAGISTKNGDRYQFLGTALGVGGNAALHTHLDFIAKGKVDEDGFFRVKSASGSIKESVSNSIMTIELETKNELK